MALQSGQFKLAGLFFTGILKFLQKYVKFPVENPSVKVKSKTQEAKSMNDNQIIELFFTRNEDAIQQTAYKYGTRLTGLAANILRNNEDAQECVNDTYLKAWDTIPPTNPNHFYAYLAKICRFFAFGKLDWKNAAKRNAEVVSLTQEMEECIPGSWHDTTVDSAEISSLVSSFLHRQTQENRMIFVRRYWYGDSISEIALRYKLSQSNVAMRLSRARSKLAAYLKKEGIHV